MATIRGVIYPDRHFGRWLEGATQAAMDRSSGLDSRSAVARWLGFDRSKFHHWTTGKNLPSTTEDILALTKLPGADEELVRSLVAADRLSALAIDEGLSPDALIRLAVRVAAVAGGPSLKDLLALTRGAVEEIEREQPSGERRAANR